MKKIVFAILASLYVFVVSAKSCDIPIRIDFKDNNSEPISEDVQNLVRGKLSQLISGTGLVGSDINSQFSLVVRFNVVNKQVVPGPPIRVVYNVDVNLSIVDLMQKSVFSSYSIQMDAVGENTNAAFLNSISQLNMNNEKLVSFIQAGKEKVINYYDLNFQRIIKESQNLASMKDYERALCMICSVPVCSKGYESSMTAAIPIYKKYVNQLCQENLSKARMVWVSKQNAEGADEASEYLNYIYPDASCYGDAMQLYKEIKNKVHEDWKFEMRHYTDSVSLESQRIEAIRAIGVAYGKGQKVQTTNLMWLR